MRIKSREFQFFEILVGKEYRKIYFDFVGHQLWKKQIKSFYLIKLYDMMEEPSKKITKSINLFLKLID